MTQAEEKAYIEGQRALLRRQLAEIMRELGHDQPEVASLVKEREDTIAALRRLCGERGDNDWPDDLYLADIIEKHLDLH